MDGGRPSSKARKRQQEINAQATPRCEMEAIHCTRRNWRRDA